VLKESILAAVLMTGANYADYHTTKPALKIAGTYEANPLIGPSGERLELVKLATITAEVLIFEKLHEKNKKLAWGFVATVVAVNVAVSISNSNHAKPISETH